MAAPHHTSDLIGGRYRLEGMIASGGMADVWRATDLTLSRIVAVKMLREDIADDVVTKNAFVVKHKHLHDLLTHILFRCMTASTNMTKLHSLCVSSKANLFVVY